MKKSVTTPRISVNFKTCICCNTRRVDRGVSDCLCEPCYDEAGYENAHSDGHHVDEPSTACHICTGEDPHATLKTRENTTGHSNGGKIADPKTDRRLAANKGLPRRSKSQRAADRKARKLAEEKKTSKKTSK